MLPRPAPLKLEAVKWKVVNTGGEASFCLSAREYEMLSRNFAEIARWVGEAGWQLDFYRRTRTPAADKETAE